MYKLCAEHGVRYMGDLEFTKLVKKEEPYPGPWGKEGDHEFEHEMIEVKAGQDQEHKDVPSAQLCQSMCQSDRECVFFQYSILEEKCFLLKERGKRITEGSSNYVSGPRSCDSSK